MPKLIQIELSHYKELVDELEILVKVGILLTVHELLDHDPAQTLASISKLVFKE
jgi:hypothetical protein